MTSLFPSRYRGRHRARRQRPLLALVTAVVALLSVGRYAR